MHSNWFRLAAIPWELSSTDIALKESAGLKRKRGPAAAADKLLADRLCFKIGVAGMRIVPSYA